MSAVEEHKPVEKRRALGRGLDSLLPSGPRVVTASPGNAGTATARTGVSEPHGPAVIPPPVVMPAPASVPEDPSAVPAEIAEIHAGSHVSQNRRDMGHPIFQQPVSQPSISQPPVDGQTRGDVVQQIPLDVIDENSYQTRRTFDPAALNELAESIKANGLAQPVVVRPGANGRYVLVLGERRCRATKLAGKTTVAAIIRRLGEEQAAEMTIVENLQRQDLNCLEQAQAFARLSREFNLTQEQIGKRTGSSRESVANYMRLLKLPKGVLNLVGEGKLGFSEARVLLEALPYLDEAGIEQMARDAIQYEWTVKELQGRLSALRDFGAPGATKEPPAPKPVDPNVKAAES